MLKLKRLKILQYRNVKPGTELHFDDGLNLILGQNASGKTTLLGLLSAVCRSAFDGISNEEFVLEYELRSDRFVVTAHVEHRQKESSNVEVGAGARWADNYEVVIDDQTTKAQTKLVPFRTSEAKATAGAQDHTSLRSSAELIMGWSFIAEGLWTERGEPDSLGAELLDAFRNTFRFDESLESFTTMTGRAVSLVGMAGPPVARVVGEKRSGGSVVSGRFVPAAFASGLHRCFRDASSGQRMLHFDGAEQEFSRSLSRALDVKNVSITPNVLEHRIFADDRSFRVEGFTFDVTRADGATIHHDLLSYGQKRLLSFLYYLECNPHVVIADELVNGLHHRWIDACMEAMSGRQAFLTSQNPLLFDYVTFDSVERVQSSFITCKLELIEGREQMVWQNMSSEDARIFFEAYEVGIEHVGDILITRGLW